MKITDIQVNQLKPPEGRAGGLLLVRVFTDEGIVGHSEGSWACSGPIWRR